MRDLEMSTNKPQGTARSLATSLDQYLPGIRLILGQYIQPTNTCVERMVCSELASRVASAAPSEEELTGFIRRNLKDIITSLGERSRRANGGTPNTVLAATAEAFLRSLPSAHQEAMSLYYCDQLPIDAVAERMGIPVIQMLDLLSQARQALSARYPKRYAATNF